MSPNTANDIDSLEKKLSKWHSSTFSFKPTAQWIQGYRKRYEPTAQNLRKQRILTPQRAEEEIPTASWLRHANWEIYYKKVLAGLKKHDRNGQGYHDVLNAADRELPVPWNTQYFKDLEKRRIIGGMKPYEWLGHVAASGKFRQLLKNGTTKQLSKLAQAINAVAILEPPIPWPELKTKLESLVALGQTMKVWGRLLCIVRPDLFSTVAVALFARIYSPL